MHAVPSEKAMKDALIKEGLQIIDPVKPDIIHPLDNTKDKRASNYPDCKTLMHEGECFISIPDFQNLLGRESRKLIIPKARSIVLKDISHLLTRFNMAAISHYTKKMAETLTDNEETVGDNTLEKE
jgi:hypothetical protein